MKRKPKRKAPHGRTEKASSRIFYRKPSEMFAEFMYSGAGLTTLPLMALGLVAFLWHVSFIKTFCG